MTGESRMAKFLYTCTTCRYRANYTLKSLETGICRNPESRHPLSDEQKETIRKGIENEVRERKLGKIDSRLKTKGLPAENLQGLWSFGRSRWSCRRVRFQILGKLREHIDSLQHRFDNVHNSLNFGLGCCVPSMCGSISDFESYVQRLPIACTNEPFFFQLLQFLFEIADVAYLFDDHHVYQGSCSHHRQSQAL